MHIQERDNTAAIVSLLCSDFHCRRGASLRVLHDTASLKWVVGRRTKDKGKEMAAAFILYSAAVEGLRSCSCSTTARCHEHVGSTRPGQRFAFSAAVHERYSNTSNSSECSCSHCQYSILHLKQLAAHTCHLCCDRLRKNALLVLRLLTLKLKTDTPFRQQTVKAWVPVLQPRLVMCLFSIIGIIFIPVGVYLRAQSNSIVEYKAK